MPTPSLRDLFPDKESVLIYPDDFDGSKNIVLEDLVDRYQGHFSSRRVVVFVRPGTYEDVNFPVGYWTQVLGLGDTPQKVQFTGSLGVYCLPANTDNPNVGSLDTFWRSAENFTSNTTFIQDEQGRPCVPKVSKEKGVKASLTAPYQNVYPCAQLEGDTSPQKGMLWAVSQAAPLRRLSVVHNLHLSLGNNNASGGFLSNTKIGNTLLFGSQQQFCVRNSSASAKTGGAWSMVLMGCNNDNDQKSTWIEPKPRGIIDEAINGPTIEKPFLFLDDKDILHLGIPRVKRDFSGIDHRPLGGEESIEIDNKDHVRVFSPHNSYGTIQEAADRGTHIILSPGIYNWENTLVLKRHNQVVLGIGMATIQAPGDGSPCILVKSHTRGVRLSGISLEASVISKFIFKGSTLLQFGEPDALSTDHNKDSETNPSAIHDLYCFVGGRRTERTVKVQCMVKIYSSHVIGDNLWLWRADHTKLMDMEAPNKPELSEYHVTVDGECKCDTGLVVFGDHVTFYGLAVEHTTADMVSWHGRHGRVFFYQSELPYDVIGDKYDKHTVGYRVHHGADNHVAKGVGVYSYFRDCPNVNVLSAVAHHAALGNFENIFTVWLNGFSGIKSVVNNDGEVTKMPGKPYFVESYVGVDFRNGHWWQGLLHKLKSILTNKL